MRFEAARDGYDLLICWLPRTDCTSDEPGWDAAEVVGAYRTRLMWSRGDSAQVEVQYDGYAATDHPERFRPRDTVLVWQPLLVRMGKRWRVVDPESQRMPFVSTATAKRVWAIGARDTAVIDSIASANGRRR